MMDVVDRRRLLGSFHAAFLSKKGQKGQKFLLSDRKSTAIH